MKSQGDIATRRHRLSVDYDLLTQERLQAHGGRSHWMSGMPSRCYTTFRRQFLPHYFASPPIWRIWLRQLSKERALPDFCIIGPAKSGTSDLAVTIMSHPHVMHPLVKELSSTDPLAWKPYYPKIKDVAHRRAQNGVALCAYVAPRLHFIDIPVVLSALRPDTKIVINLRNPVDLVFSIWKWTMLHTKRQLVDRVSPLSTFPTFVDNAIELFPEISSPIGAALHYGIYSVSVGHWLQAFGEQNVRVFDIADYFRDRSNYIYRLEQFLGLPHCPLPPRMQVANENPLRNLSPAPEASAKLRDFFEPHNCRLWDVIGTTYPW